MKTSISFIILIIAFNYSELFTQKLFIEKQNGDNLSVNHSQPDVCDTMNTSGQTQTFENSTPFVLSGNSSNSIIKNSPSDISSHRSFVIPTAQTLPQGRLAYENYYFIFHGVHYGVHDRVTINGGYMFYPKDNKKRLTGDHFVLMGAKWKINEYNRTRSAIGIQAVKGFGKTDMDMTYVYGAVGNGDPDDLQYNVNLGYIYRPKEKSFLLTSLDYQSRISDHFKFIGEVIFLPGFEIMGTESPIFAACGLRYLRKSISLDVGFISDFRFLPGLPVINFTIKL